MIHYQRNPVVLWSHDHGRVPIAKTIALTPSSRALTAVLQFPEPGVYGLADLVFRQLADGFLNAVSVGFCASKVQASNDRDRARYGGVDILEAELHEISVVTVPSNRAALVEGRQSPRPSGTKLARYRRELDRLKAGRPRVAP